MNFTAARWLSLALACVLGAPPTTALADEADDAIAAHIREHATELEAQGASRLPLTGVSLPRGVAAFYRQRDYAPAWTPARVRALLAELEDLRADGLDPQDYHVADLQRALADWPKRVEARADLDLLATQSCLLGLLHLYRGKVEPASLDPRWNFEPRAFDRQSGLRAVAQALDRGEIAPLFAAARPQHPIYAALRAALRQLREIEAAGGWPELAAGASLRPGDLDPRVPALRRRLIAAGDLSPASAEGESYDAEVEAAVRRFQQEQYLEVDGVVGRATRAVLNVPVSARIDQLRVNLERARWLLPRIAGEFVLVDVAGYKLRYYQHGQPIWTTRVQVGRNLRRTPIFQAQITHITLNPAWTVPPTILREDILPKLARDPDFLARNRIRVLDGRGRELEPGQVDWRHAQGLRLRQDPGPDNSLGRIRINFPNPYGVYLHQTPHTELFGKSQRGFSSGCIRVEQPLELAQRLLDDPALWNVATLDAAIATGRTRELRLPRPVPILVLYWTVDLHEGRPAFKPDLYQLDGPTLRALEQPPQ